jgi:hypothetical protein
MLALILKFLGPIISGPIVTTVLEGYKAKLGAENNHEKLSVDLAIAQAKLDAQREELELNSVNTEQGKWFPLVRWGFALPFIIFNMKVIVWDRMLHLGVTDYLSQDLVSLEQSIVYAYFGHSAIQMGMSAYLKTRK